MAGIARGDNAPVLMVSLFPISLESVVFHLWRYSFAPLCSTESGIKFRHRRMLWFQDEQSFGDPHSNFSSGERPRWSEQCSCCSALAAGGVLGLRLNCCGSDHSAGIRAAVSPALRASTIGRTRQSIRIARDTHTGTHSPGVALCSDHAIPRILFRKSKENGWPDYTLLSLGAVVGLTAYAMSAYSVGGWVERSAVLVFNTFFLFSIFRAYLYMRHGDLLLKRRWLIRAIAILLGIAVTRPVMGIFFATSPLTHLQPSQFFGIAFWIGFSTREYLNK